MLDVEEQKAVPLNTENEQTEQEQTGSEARSKDGLRNKGIYLLPNLFTTGALFSGFYAVVASMDGHFDKAAIAIFVAMILDGLDGRVARLTNTQSEFGAEYDSLADMVSFGVAPALITFSWCLQSLGQAGWIAAFIYVAGAALRLARFNTQIDTADKNYFTGLASPAAGAIVAGTVWVFNYLEVDPSTVAPLMAIIVGLAGLLMVSNVQYHSFKGIDLKGKVPFVAMLAVVGVFAVIATNPPIVLLAIFLIYGGSGPIMTAWKMLKARKAAK